MSEIEQHDNDGLCPRCGSDNLSITRIFEEPWYCEDCHWTGQLHADDENDAPAQRGKEGVSSPTRPVLRYHGGKWRLAPWIIEHFPEHRIYVEPFGGGASVLMRKRPSREEVYNDIDSDIVNVFRVLRDDKQSKELQHLLALTPFAREEFEAAYKPVDSDPVEQARRTIVRSFMAQGSGGATRNDMNGWRSRRTGDRWPVRDWQTYQEALPVIIERLREVTIENKPAVDVIARYDGPEVLIYADPPYMPETRTQAGQKAYRHEMTAEDHCELAKLLTGVTAMVVLSGYDSPLYHEYFGDWLKVSKPTRATNHAERVDCLWISPDAAGRLRQKDLGIGGGVTA